MKEYKDYFFGNKTGKDEQGELLESGESVLDPKGTLSLDFPLDPSVLRGTAGLLVSATVVDFDGRLLGQASPGPGERIVVAPIDVGALRHERASRRGHHMLAHLRTEAYPVYRGHQYPPRNLGDTPVPSLSYDTNVERIDAAKRALLPGMTEP